MKLQLGCGHHPRDGWVNLDRASLEGVDVVHDLDIAPWPFEDKSAEEIEARHVFEHVTDPCLFMTECHRILAPGGTLEIVSPYFQHFSAFTDPTHRRFCTPETWDYWVPGTLYHDPEIYGDAAFERVSVQLGNERTTLRAILRKS